MGFFFFFRRGRLRHGRHMFTNNAKAGSAGLGPVQLADLGPSFLNGLAGGLVACLNSVLLGRFISVPLPPAKSGGSGAPLDTPRNPKHAAFECDPYTAELRRLFPSQTAAYLAHLADSGQQLEAGDWRAIVGFVKKLWELGRGGRGVPPADANEYRRRVAQNQNQSQKGTQPPVSCFTYLSRVTQEITKASDVAQHVRGKDGGWSKFLSRTKLVREPAFFVASYNVPGSQVREVRMTGAAAAREVQMTVGAAAREVPMTAEAAGAEGRMTGAAVGPGVVLP
eukprot:g8688.t1